MTRQQRTRSFHRGERGSPATVKLCLVCIMQPSLRVSSILCLSLQPLVRFSERSPGVWKAACSEQCRQTAKNSSSLRFTRQEIFLGIKIIIHEHRHASLPPPFFISLLNLRSRHGARVFGLVPPPLPDGCMQGYTGRPTRPVRAVTVTPQHYCTAEE